MTIFHFTAFRKKTPAAKPLRIRFDKIDGFIISLDDKIKHFI